MHFIEYVSVFVTLYFFLEIQANDVQCDGTGRCVSGGFETGPGASWIGRGYLGFSPLSCCDVFV